MNYNSGVLEWWSGKRGVLEYWSVYELKAQS